MNEGAWRTIDGRIISENGQECPPHPAQQINAAETNSRQIKPPFGESRFFSYASS